MTRKSYIITIFALLLISFLPFFWYRQDSIIGGGDRGLPLDYKLYFEKGISTWDASINVGRNRIIGISRLPEFYLFKFISLFDLPDNKIQIIYFSLLLLGVLFSFYFFAFQIMAESRSKEKYAVAFLSPIFYFFNFFSLTRWEGFDRPILYQMIGIPLIIGILVRNIRKESPFNYFLLGVFSILFSYAVVNPPSFLAGVLTVSLFYLFLLAKNFFNKDVERLKKLLILGVKALLVILVCNLFWIIPTISLGSPTAIFQETAPADWLGGIDFNKVIRLMGAWYWYDGWGGKPYAPYAQIYQTNEIFIIMTYLVPLFVLIGVFFSKKKKESYFLLPILLVGIVFSMGDQKPFGVIYRFLYEHIIFFKVFRSPWFKFSLLTTLAYSFYFGIFSAEIVLKAKSYLSKYVAVFLILIFFSFPIVLAHPLIMSPFFKDIRVKIPEYVKDSLKFLDKNLKEGERIYLPTYGQNDNYPWGYLSPLPVLYHLTTWPILGPWYDSFPNDLSNLLVKAIDSNLGTGGEQRIDNLLSYLGVKYLILREDILYVEGQQKEIVRDKIKNQKNVAFIKNFSEWDVFENTNPFPLFALKTNLINVSDSNLFLKILGSEEADEIYCIDCGNLPNLLKRYHLFLADFTQKEGVRRSFPFTVNGETEYNFLVKTGDGLREVPLVYLDDKRMLLQGKEEGRYLAKEHIFPGKHALSFDAVDISQKDLIKNGDFSKGLMGWDYFGIGQGYGLPVDSSLGEFGLGKVRLQAVNQTAVMRQKIAGLEKNKKYRLRFTFESLGMLPLQMGIGTEKNGLPEIIVNEEFQKFISKKEVGREVLFVSPSADVVVSFYAKVNSTTPNTQIISNISLEEVSGMESIDVVPVIEDKYPTPAFQKVDQTQYKLDFSTDSAAWLNFNSTYDKGWKAFENGKELQHIICNSFANCYYISGPGEHIVDIVFQTQPVFRKMTNISVGFIALLLLFSLFHFLKRDENK